jgi:hypothetical protein
VVLPEHPWWNASPEWMTGKTVADDFTYASDTNDWWLTSDELESLIS